MALSIPTQLRKRGLSRCSLSKDQPVNMPSPNETDKLSHSDGESTVSHASPPALLH